MNRPPALLVRLIALALCAGVGLATRLPSTGDDRRADLAGRFAFSTVALNGDPTGARDLRVVQPALRDIESWISAVGAAVALADLDGDGLPNERCLVDPRDDSVTVAPTPEAADRFPGFALRPAGLAYDARTTAPMGCLPADLNEDGRLDILVYFWGRAPIAYLHRSGPGLNADSFQPVDVVDEPGRIWNSATANVVDLDGDGHLDIFVGNYFPDGARVLDATATDDPLMQMQDSMSAARNAGRNRILRLQTLTTRDGLTRPSYEDQSGALTDEQSRRWTLATGAQDLDGDGRPELYVANDFGPDYLLHNRSKPGRIQFTELRGSRDALAPKSKVLGDDSFKGMGVAFTDLNADDRADLVVSNITTEYALEESNFAFVSTDDHPLGRRTAPYRDESQALGLARTGWGWDIKAADFDGDGRDELVQALGFLKGTANRWAELQELAMTNDAFLRHAWAWPVFREGADIAGHQRNPFFVRDDASGRFTDVAADLGLANPGVSRGIAIGDVDHDGRLDMAVANQWARSTFAHNDGPAREFLGLSLHLPAATAGAVPRPAIGATATVTRPDGTTATQQLYPANGHTGVNAPDLLFGLAGSGPGPFPVTVRWRDIGGLHTTTTTLRAGWHDLTLTDRPVGTR
ncbi:VCBS repeat-containing protein [Actinoplanes bogorensis]|uniref:VCBS repeat-containing protein n=1 Tax=Paractinoplanes bogorensis TaxID=1610840 RepID=A0ABS5YV22_9ACTN|nr:VCBS repeat-containing protein [Actinoplanes bogorensis]MBU2667265.1 VCBS repeat-containing protein [Actinoplanes bogorensis]